MRTFWTVYFFELKRFALAPVTWLTLLLTLQLQLGLTYLVGDFLTQNEASLSLFWGYFPLTILLLAPLLAMQSWAGERQRGTAALLESLPLSPFVVDLAKYLALTKVFGWWLLASLMMPLTVWWFGQPDVGQLVAGYLSAVLLGLAMLGLAFLGSSCARSLLGGYLMGLLLCGLALAAGWDVVGRLLGGVLPVTARVWLLDYNLLGAFQRLATGYVMVADVGLLLGVAVLSFVAAHLVRRRRLNFHCRRWLWAAVLVVVLGLLGWSQPCRTAFDISSRQLYTPSAAVLKMLDKLPGKGIQVALFASLAHPDMSPAQRQYIRQIDAYMRQLAAETPKISYEEQDPLLTPRAEQVATKLGIKPQIADDGSRLYAGIGMTNGQQLSTIPQLNPAREQVFQYDFMNALQRLTPEVRPHLAVVSDLNLGDAKKRPQFLRLLSERYRVSLVTPDNAILPDANDLVIVLFGHYLAEPMIYALDQYVARGGKVLVLTDPDWLGAYSPILRMAGPDDGETARPGLDDLLRHWGLGYDSGHVVADATLSSVASDAVSGVTRNPLWLDVPAHWVDTANPYLQDIHQLLFADSGHFTVSAAALQSGRVTPLVRASDSAVLLPRKQAAEVPVANLLTDVPATGNGEQVIAALAKGVFQPFYATPPEPARDWLRENKSKWPAAFWPAPVTTATKAGEVMAVADMDFLDPRFALVPDASGKLRLRNDNLNFLLNSVAMLLAEPPELMVQLGQPHAQGLTGLTAHLSKLSAARKGTEQGLLRQLFEVRDKLQIWQRQHRADKITDPVAQRQLLTLQEQDVDLLRQLDVLRRATQRSLNTVLWQVVLFNMLGAALVLLLMGAGYRFWSRWRNARFAC